MKRSDFSNDCVLGLAPSRDLPAAERFQMPKDKSHLRKQTSYMLDRQQYTLGVGKIHGIQSNKLGYGPKIMETQFCKNPSKVGTGTECGSSSRQPLLRRPPSGWNMKTADEGPPSQPRGRRQEFRSNDVSRSGCRSDSMRVCKKCYMKKVKEEIEFMRDRKKKTTAYVREFNDFLRYEILYEKIVQRQQKMTCANNRRKGSLMNPATNGYFNSDHDDSESKECHMEYNNEEMSKLSDQISFKKNLLFFLNNVFKLN